MNMNKYQYYFFISYFMDSIDYNDTYTSVFFYEYPLSLLNEFICDIDIKDKINQIKFYKKKGNNQKHGIQFNLAY